MKKLILFFCSIVCLMSCGDDDINNDCIDTSKIEENPLCPLVLAPVCGCDGNTYSNGCMAEAAGITSFTQGGCNN